MIFLSDSHTTKAELLSGCFVVFIRGFLKIVYYSPSVDEVVELAELDSVAAAKL